MQELKGRVVVITGAANGIGRSLAVEYAKRGAALALLDKDKLGLYETGKLLKEGSMSIERVLDLQEAELIPLVFQSILEHFQKMDILINNAGFGITKPLFELELEQWDSVINTNLRATFLCTREAAKSMKDRGGSVVNIASTRALMSEPNTEAYAASKGGVLALTHAMAISLGPYKIRVNAISPGWIETKYYGDLRPIDHEQHPSGRVGRPEDIARACLYLTHPENDFITGTNLIIDGGMTKRMIYEE